MKAMSTQHTRFLTGGLTLLMVGLWVFTLLDSANAQGKTPRRFVANPNYTPTITVFTAAQYPMTGIDELRAKGSVIHLLRLDTLDSLAQYLNSDLPADPEQAIAEVRQRAAELEANQSIDLRGHARALTAARKMGVERIPAVVFGFRQGVVYGITDVREAVAIWREKRPSPDQAQTGRKQP